MSMTIQTQRLLLRPFQLSDAEDIFAYLANPSVHCFADMRLHSLQAAEAEMQKRAADPDFYFAISLKESGKVIGEIFAHPEEQGDTFSPCWMLHEAYHGKGYAYEAAKAFFSYLFREKGARRIYAYTEDYNLHSQHLCEKLGMRKEGEYKEFVSFVNDEEGNPIYENTLEYAILKKEWEQFSPSASGLKNRNNAALKKRKGDFLSDLLRKLKN